MRQLHRNKPVYSSMDIIVCPRLLSRSERRCQIHSPHWVGNSNWQAADITTPVGLLILGVCIVEWAGII